ncbi:MAG: ATP synthase F0 subunit B [Deltaproteobacteria bacterium]|nr:ATP synthase F0 subunit B [Deltaproteobacteria bacterium]
MSKRIFNRISGRHWVFAALTLVLTAQGVMAEDGANTWRPVYDVALRWINFGILVFILFKYARKPLVNFFKEKSAAVKKEIQAIEHEKEAILVRVDEILTARDQSQKKLEKLKARIITQGKAKKQTLIDNAQKESKILLESAQRKIQNQIISAQADIRAEMIDHAIEMALQKLPAEIDEKDNRQFYEHYLENTKGL